MGAATVLMEPISDEREPATPPAGTNGPAEATSGGMAKGGRAPAAPPAESASALPAEPASAPPTEPASALVERARAGDELAFARLVRSVRDQLYRWALVKTGDPDDAEDVTQEVLLKLRRALPAFDGRSRLTTWLYTIVRTTAADLHRRRTRRAEVLEEAAREAVAEAAPPPGLDQERLSSLVLAFFRELPERQREVFDLCELQGHPSPEVAEMLGIEPVSVRASLFKARRTIRSRILEEHPELVEDR